jgi:hypothetical protein
MLHSSVLQRPNQASHSATDSPPRCRALPADLVVHNPDWPALLAQLRQALPGYHVGFKYGTRWAGPGVKVRPEDVQAVLAATGDERAESSEAKALVGSGWSQGAVSWWLVCCGCSCLWCSCCGE